MTDTKADAIGRSICHSQIPSGRHAGPLRATEEAQGYQKQQGEGRARSWVSAAVFGWAGRCTLRVGWQSQGRWAGGVVPGLQHLARGVRAVEEAGAIQGSAELAVSLRG